MVDNLLQFKEGDTRFAKEFRNQKNVYSIENNKGEWLGFIKKKHVGRFMHWCFFPAGGFEQIETDELWFSNGCLKEISAFITSLYRKGRNNDTHNTKVS